MTQPFSHEIQALLDETRRPSERFTEMSAQSSARIIGSEPRSYQMYMALRRKRAEVYGRRSRTSPSVSCVDTVTEYRFFHLDKNGRIAGPPSVARCENDEAAVLYASKSKRVGAIWTGAQQIAFTPSDE